MDKNTHTQREKERTVRMDSVAENLCSKAGFSLRGKKRRGERKKRRAAVERETKSVKETIGQEAESRLSLSLSLFALALGLLRRRQCRSVGRQYPQLLSSRRFGQTVSSYLSLRFSLYQSTTLLLLLLLPPYISLVTSLRVSFFLFICFDHLVSPRAIQLISAVSFNLFSTSSPWLLY